MSGKFSFEVKDAGDHTVFAFTGTIDEDVDFTKVPLAKKPVYVFDFEGVRAINSCGIREWVKFSEGIEPATKLVYLNCTQIIIEQINMVAGFFRSGSEVRTFYAPYFCEGCDEERKVRIETKTVSGGSAPEVKCADCGAAMEFDALEEQYFRFLKMAG